MYHRVADVSCDPWRLAVSPANFAAQLEMLRRTRTVLPMEAFAEAARKNSLPRNVVAITFDDGYLDNLHHASPALAAEGLPATLFLATGPTLNGIAYWWEELAAMLLDAPAPADLTLDLGGEILRISFGEREPLDERREDWGVGQPRTRREESYLATWRYLHALPPSACAQAMDQLRLFFPSSGAAECRPMNRDEVAALVRQGSFSLGGHTADHPDLTALDDGEALDQIVRGKTEAEAIAGQRLTGFAYPFGRFDERVRRLAADAGFAWACTTAHVPVTAGCDMLAIPRMTVPDRPDVSFLG